MWWWITIGAVLVLVVALVEWRSRARRRTPHDTSGRHDAPPGDGFHPNHQQWMSGPQ